MRAAAARASREASTPRRTAAPAPTPEPPVRPERWIVLALCVLAAIRVFVFSAAFPFFNNVDEPSHYDLVRKYARGDVPRGLEVLDAPKPLVLYNSPEYLTRPGPEGVAPPLWTLPPAIERAIAEPLERELATHPNYEATQPPLYYAVAGAWLRLGEALALRGARLLYWIRDLDVLVVAFAVWLTWIFSKLAFADEPFVRLGAPLLVAFLPQDVFYSINNDVLLPLVCGGALILLLRVLRAPPPSLPVYAAAGLLAGASLLVKFSAIALPLVAIGVAIVLVARARGDERPATIARAAVLASATLALPVAWGARNALVLHDVTGTAAKIAILHWTPKPLGQLFDHPIFLPEGMWTFWSQTLATFWRGEFVWHLQPIASEAWDTFYAMSSLALLLSCARAPLLARKSIPPERSAALAIGGATFVLSLAFLALVSIRYDFDGCTYPSSLHPFLTSGRLAMGALIPFAALYVYGLRLIVPWRAPRWIVLVAIVLGMTISEVWMSRPVFASAFNWFHLP